MSGVDVRVKSNIREVLSDLRTAASKVPGTIADAVAEAGIAFSEDMRGPSPGAGLTPFRTGNLQSAGRMNHDRLRFSYENDARPYSPSNAEQGDRVTIHGGRESYASFAHFDGGQEGDFAALAEDAFNKRFGKVLADRAETKLLRALDV